MLRFAEDEVVVPDGPYEGERFRAERQPFARLFFDEVDSGAWTTVAVTGPSQTGKSLIGYVIPGLYHLFEIRETVICGVPHMAMAADKWAEDFLPAIEASRYKQLLPRSGPGSRGGKMIEAVRFRNGATLRFMSGGGDDKKRSAFTARVLLVTEANGLARMAATSNEASKIKQLIARTRAFGPRARVYAECTEETEADYIHQTITAGSDSTIVLPCPHCGEYVAHDREHLVGWKDADDELEAEETAHLVCPSCRQPWTEAQRVAANREARLVHRGQTIDAEGSVEGDRPRTRTLGFRWSCVHNLLNPIASVGAEEWAADRAVDEESAERELKQFVWAVPIEPDNAEVLSLTVQGIIERQGTTPQGLVPAWSDVLTLGIDEGQYLFHWVLMAGDLSRHRHVQIVDYGITEVHSHQHRLETALEIALRELTAEADDRGWPDENGEVRHPDLVWWDSGWKPVPTYRHCKQMGPKHWPAKGQGLGQYGGAKYFQPKTTGATVLRIYDGFHLTKIKHDTVGSVQLYECDANLGKSRIHDRLNTPIDEPGAILLPKVDRAVEHTSFAKHLLAEQLIDDGGVQKWMPTPGHGRRNHWLDAAALALMAMMRRWHQPKPRRKRTTGAWAK